MLHESILPLRPRIIFDNLEDEHQPEEEEAAKMVAEMASGTQIELSMEGYADDTYMLALCIASLPLCSWPPASGSS